MAPSRLSIALAGLLPICLAATSECNGAALNTTTYYYNITTVGTTIFDVAAATGRGVCDIGRANLMADVTIIPNVGQTIVIPAQVCEPDNTTCILTPSAAAGDCIFGGPRLYYTVHGDTYEKIALRLNITTETLTSNAGPGQNISAVLEPGQFVKIPQCQPSECIMQPYTFGEAGVYKDLAEKFGTTVGQIMMLSPTYNYSTSLKTGATHPGISIPMNCTALSSNFTATD